MTSFELPISNYQTTKSGKVTGTWSGLCYCTWQTALGILEKRHHFFLSRSSSYRLWTWVHPGLSFLSVMVAWYFIFLKSSMGNRNESRYNFNFTAHFFAIFCSFVQLVPRIKLLECYGCLVLYIIQLYIIHILNSST